MKPCQVYSKMNITDVSSEGFFELPVSLFCWNDNIDALRRRKHPGKNLLIIYMDLSQA